MGILAVAAACGGSATAGPSPVAPVDGTVSAVLGTAHRSGTHVAVPGLPADYVEALLYGGPPNETGPHALRAWEAGPFKHCVGAGIDAAVVAHAAAAISAVSGIPQRTDGPCNLTWEVSAEGLARGSGAGSGLILSGQAIVGAYIRVRPGVAAGYLDDAVALHELGHAIGLGHSARAGDVMFQGGATSTAFSADESVVIAAVYGR